MNKQNKNENTFINVGINVLIPVLILSYLSKDQYLGANFALIIALLFPISYGLWDYFSHKDINFMSLLGLFNISLTGGIGLLKLPVEYFALKEALIPLLLGIIVLIGEFLHYSFIKQLLQGSLNLDAIKELLQYNPKKLAEYNKSLSFIGYSMAASFLLSAILNYSLASYLVKSPTGTAEFNAELGQMTLYTYPVIALPCFLVTIGAMFIFFRKISKLTEKSLEDVLQLITY